MMVSYLEQRWHAEDNAIRAADGWCIAKAADWLTVYNGEAIARHICRLHNATVPRGDSTCGYCFGTGAKWGGATEGTCLHCEGTGKA